MLRVATRSTGLPLILTLLTAFGSAAAHAAERTIQVTGTGKVSAPPDMATFETAVVTEAPTAAAALEANSASVQRVMAVLKNLEIADKDIQTSRLDINPRYVSTQQNPEPVISGYIATNQLTVRIRNLPQLGRVLDAVVQNGSNQISSIRFAIDNSAGLMNDARGKALADAKSRAELYAHGASGKVGKVLSIREESTPDYRPRPEFAQMRMMAADAAVPVATGEMNVEVSIHVTYELVD